MTRDLTASEFLMSQIDLRDDAFTAEERAHAEKDRAFIEAVAKTIIQARSGRVEEKLAALEVLVQTSPELVAYFLDDYYTREMLEAIPKQVQRTLVLAQLEVLRAPSKTTSVYLQEAIRTYIVGLPQASVALSRAALEQALKESIGYQSTNTFVTMSDLLNEAESAKVLDEANRKFAREVADAADQVLHEKPTTLSDALNVLIKMRGVIRFIYSEE